MATSQPGLFDAPRYQTHSPTSRAAAKRAKRTSVNDRYRVLAYLRDQGERGATDEEIQRALCMNPSTERPRRLELVNAKPAALARDSGEKRPTASGCRAVVWVAV